MATKGLHEGRRTIATNPQQRPVLLPTFEFTALYEPHCSSIVMCVTCGVMIHGRIWGSEPCSKLVPQLVPYEDGSAMTISEEGMRESRTLQVIHCCFNI
jgi:hypothetical protein